ncbi:MAG: magnesium transporter CorA family protein [Cypionkella sp.]|nr:magnesium transporter CorA family protein [Cypionkella sp.]
MIFAYSQHDKGLQQLPDPPPLEGAIWVDLYRPTPEQEDQARALGVDVPSLADMEEIEVSNRLYREDSIDYMTVVLPGMSQSQTPISGPVCFALSQNRLVTIRHHAPRPFETYGKRADKSGPGCATPARVFLGLMEEITGRLADLLEGAGSALDGVMRDVFHNGDKSTDEFLHNALRQVGREGDLIGRVRLSLLTIQRALGFFGQNLEERAENEALKPLVKAIQRDVQALEVHADFLSSRLGLATDTTLGVIGLTQNGTVKILSVVAALFLPPTLIASAYGMNFGIMPELHWRYGYPMALGMMLATAVGTYLFLKWKRWL